MQMLWKPVWHGSSSKVKHRVLQMPQDPRTTIWPSNTTGKALVGFHLGGGGGGRRCSGTTQHCACTKHHTTCAPNTASFVILELGLTKTRRSILAFILSRVALRHLGSPLRVPGSYRGTCLPRQDGRTGAQDSVLHEPPRTHGGAAQKTLTRLPNGRDLKPEPSLVFPTPFARFTGLEKIITRLSVLLCHNLVS